MKGLTEEEKQKLKEEQEKGGDKVGVRQLQYYIIFPQKGKIIPTKKVDKISQSNPKH